MTSKGQLGLLILPPELETDAFREAWGEWLADRAERRLPRYTSRAQQMQMARLAEMGTEAAVEAIRWSISQGYKGIWQPPAKSQKAGAHAEAPEPAWALEKRLVALKARLRDLEFPGGCAYAVELTGAQAEQATKLRSDIRMCKAKLEANDAS
jgi:hypothetical protein